MPIKAFQFITDWEQSMSIINASVGHQNPLLQQALSQNPNTTFHIETLNPTPVRNGKTVVSELTVCATTAPASPFMAHDVCSQHHMAQNFIQQVYEISHQAKLSYFMPILFSGFSQPTSTIAATHNSVFIPSVAIGLTPVTQQPIFLEQYLNSPIEIEIAKIAGQHVPRERICEIGNLASQCAGNARLMVAFLVFYLSSPITKLVDDSACPPNAAATKVDWAVCTGTNVVQHILSSMGIESHVVARATVDALQDPEQQSTWGSYYDNNPLVLAIDVAKSKAVCSPYYRYTEHTHVETGVSADICLEPTENYQQASVCTPTANKPFNDIQTARMQPTDMQKTDAHTIDTRNGLLVTQSSTTQPPVDKQPACC